MNITCSTQAVIKAANEIEKAKDLALLMIWMSFYTMSIPLCYIQESKQ
jgi:hypothetical protein